MNNLVKPASSTLYIIGNGFDIHYGLHTQVDDFKEILETKDIYNSYCNTLDFFANLGVDWSDFEEGLKYFDLEEFAEQNEIMPDYLSDHESDRDGGISVIEEMTRSLLEAVEDSLREMADNANHDLTEIPKPFKLPFQIQPGDAIINFNYTSTIEYLYGNQLNYLSIPVFHIHGCYADGDDLIYGYSQPVSHDIRSSDDYYLMMQDEAINDLYKTWEKPMQITRLGDFLQDYGSDCLGKLITVKTYGHKMNNVDLPYMDDIDRMLCPARWDISYHNPDEYADLLDRLKKTRLWYRVRPFYW